MLEWRKIGRIFDPTRENTEGWMKEFAQIPFPLVMGDRLRVYFATRPSRDSDLQYISRTGFVELSREDITNVVRVSKKPIMDLGGPGAFDEFGSMASSFVWVGDELFVYYTGWTRLTSVPYTMAIGMGISRDGGETFEKVSPGPIMGQSMNEPYLLSGPIVRRIDGRWHMWYLNGVKWISDKGKYEPVYKICHAASQDGFAWERDGTPIIASLTEDECQVSFALFRRDDRWVSIFAYRKPLGFRDNKEHSYRLGLAWSHDLLEWKREDSLVGLDISDGEEWDSEMISYPQICEVDGKVFLFYCGNQFGRKGFGAAELLQ